MIHELASVTSKVPFFTTRKCYSYLFIWGHSILQYGLVVFPLQQHKCWGMWCPPVENPYLSPCWSVLILCWPHSPAFLHLCNLLLGETVAVVGPLFKISPVDLRWQPMLSLCSFPCESISHWLIFWLGSAMTMIMIMIMIIMMMITIVMIMMMVIMMTRRRRRRNASSA